MVLKYWSVSLGSLFLHYGPEKGLLCILKCLGRGACDEVCCKCTCLVWCVGLMC